MKGRLSRLCLVSALLSGCDDAGREGSDVSEQISLLPGPTMRPGDNCLRCHNPLGQAARRPWTAAGTVFPRLEASATEGVEGVTVKFTDSAGTVVETLTSNEVGNFYTDKALPDPYFVSLHYEGKTIAMPCAPPAGSCNACHSPNPVGFAPGRIDLPGARAEPGPFDCADWGEGGSGRP